MLGVLAHAAERDLMGAEGALDRHAVDLAAGRSSPSACAARSPASAVARPPRRRCGRASWIARDPRRGVWSSAAAKSRWTWRGSSPATNRGVVAVAAQQASTISPRRARPSTVGPEILFSLRCRIGSTAPSRAGLRKRMPFHEPSSGAGLGLAVADHAGDEQVGVVEGGAEGVHERVAELAALVDRARRRHADVARDPARASRTGAPAAAGPPSSAETSRVDLRVGALEVDVGDDRRAAVARAGDVEHLVRRSRGSAG